MRTLRPTFSGDKMKISAVIHTYNRASLVTRVLEAVLGQIRCPDEIIVMDDGSSDGTSDILRQRFGDRICLYRQDNAGCELARARAISTAKGDWIALCDSDDIWHPDHLARLTEVTSQVPTADLVFTNFTEVGTAAIHADKFSSLNGSFWQDADLLDDNIVNLGPDSFPRLLNENPVFPSAMMFRKSAYLSIGGIDGGLNNILGSDADLTRRLALAGIVACDRKISVDILKNGENMSSDTIRMNLGRIEILKRNLQQGAPFRAYEAEIQQAISDTACSVMMSAFWVRDLDRFREVATEVRFKDRPMPLKARTLLVHMPTFARDLLFRVYEKAIRQT